MREHRLVASAIIVATIASIGALPRAADAGTCANEAFRAAQTSTALPECRAYELVSPPGAVAYVAPDGRIEGTRAAAAGAVGTGGVSWFSYYPPPGFVNSSMYLRSTRSASGWSTEDVMPTQSTSSGALIGCGGYMYFSPDLAGGILSDGQQSIGIEQGNQELCGHNEPPLVEGEPEGFQSLFFREFATGGYSLVNVTPSGASPADAQLQDASTDLRHAVFSEEAKLTPNAPAGEDLYEWAGGAVRLVSVLPDGTPVAGKLVDGTSFSQSIVLGFAPFTHAVSRDGRRAIFEAGGKLYLRENADSEQSSLGSGGECLEATKACTVQIDASTAGGAGGGGRFLAANAADTVVYFTDSGVAKLTGDTVPGSGQNLYEFDAATGTVADLTPVEHADVRGLVGIGEEEAGGSRVYVVAEGVLSGADAEGRTPQSGAPNLYAFVGGGPAQLLATLAPADARDWESELREANVSENGRHLAFSSTAQLTGYPNADAASGEPDAELFLYDSDTEHLTCISCGGAGEAPIGPATVHATESSNVGEHGPGYLRRNVLDDGRVFFDTPNALVPGDVNDRPDVYEYVGGEPQLISSGTSSSGSYFYEASGVNAATGDEGEDVFFATSQRLLGSDTANGPALYDARVEGGLPEPPPSPEGCDGEGCHGPASEAPPIPVPASSALSGFGNVLPGPPAKPKAKAPRCRKGHIRKRGKCVKKKRKKAKRSRRSSHGGR